MDVYTNLLTSLPESLGQLAPLEQSYVQVNLLTSLPGDFGQRDSVHYVVTFSCLAVVTVIGGR